MCIVFLLYDVRPTKYKQYYLGFNIGREELKAENKELKRRLVKYETKKSHNSSISPSKDEKLLQCRSLREKRGRKPRGQRSRKGNTLKMLSMPDIIKK